MGWLRDLSTARRRLRREPAFALLAACTLGLGLGVTLAVFVLVEGILLRPLNFTAPGELYSVREVIPRLTRQYPSLPVNYLSFAAWRAQAASLSGLALVHPAATDLTRPGEPRQVVVDQVSANLFPLLGVAPMLGRGFLPGEDAPGRNHVVVLSQAFWRRHYGGSPSALGQTVTLDGVGCEIVGVLPASFHFVEGRQWGTFTAAAAAADEPDMFQPTALTAAGQEVIGNFDYGVIARLRPGINPVAARAELDRITAGLVATAPGPGLQVVTALTPLQEQITGAIGPRLWLLLASVLAVLLLICLNLANLMLVRAHARAPEAALRQALGAGRGQLARVVLLEGAWLAGAGLILALGLAGLVLEVLRDGWAASLPRLAAVHLDGAAAGAAVLAAVVAALLCAGAAARRWAASDVAAGLRQASPRLGGGAGRGRNLLVGIESALTTLLLVTTALLLHSYMRLANIPPGYDAAPKLIAAVDLAGAPDARRALWQALPSRIETLPGVAVAALSTELPLQGTGVTSPILLPGDARPLAERPIASYQFVSPGYFAAMGIAVRGRELNPGDAAPHAPAAVVVSAAAAARAWPGQTALGRTFQSEDHGPVFTVVGVAEDVRTDLRRAPGPMVFEPSWQDLKRHLAYLVIRPQPGAKLDSLAAEVRATVHGLQPAAVVTRTETMREVRAGVVAPERLQFLLMAGFGLAALLVAALGIYAVVAYAVEQRMPEIGIRVAIGASRRQVAAWVLRQGLTPVLAGLGSGLAGAVLLARALAAQLYGVSPRDPWSLLLSTLALLVAAVLACALPARRAARADPLILLRR